MKKYIVNNTKKRSLGVACLKQPVYAMLVTADNKEYFGSNEMKASCVTVCPREELNLPSGVGYHHCKETCQQDEHAEREAINRAKADGVDTVGSTIFLVGHHYCCDECMDKMKKAGVSKVVFIDTGKEEIITK